MIPVYLITLKDTPWKHKATLHHLNDVGIEPKIVWGFMGTACAIRSCNPYDHDSLGNPKYAHPSVIACSMSHMAALAAACANRDSEFLIFEDDVKLPDDFLQKWAEFRKKIPDEIDIVQLDYIHEDKNPRVRINDALEHCYYPFGSGAIWWRGDIVEDVLHMMRPINGPYDVMLIRNVYPFFKHAIASPRMTTQRSGNDEWASTIGAAIWKEM